MSWQDDLQQLDLAFSNGQISAEDYRQRRDQLLAQAAAPEQQAPQPPQSPPAPQPPAQPQPQGQPPVQQQPPSSPPGGFPAQPTPNPFPPGYTWEPRANEPTQAVQPGGPAPGQPQPAPPQGDSAERTQVVRPVEPGEWAKGGPAGQSDSDSPERTQVVRPVGAPGTPPPGFPSQPGGGSWPPVPGQGTEAESSPWGSNELPPDFGGSAWPSQGPEIFEEPRSGKGRRLALILVIVVVLIGAGVGIFFAVSKGPSNQASPGGTTTSAPSSPVNTGPPLPSGPFVAVPGTQQLNQTWPIADAIAANVPEAAALQAAGVSQITGYVFEESNGVREGIWVFTPGPGVTAKSVLTSVDSLYSKSGWQLMSGNVPTGVFARTLPSSGTADFRAHYMTQGVVVRVEAWSAPTGGAPVPASAKQQAFLALLNKETSVYPPSSQ
jgi:hypothetical protein